MNRMFSALAIALSVSVIGCASRDGGRIPPQTFYPAGNNPQVAPAPPAPAPPPQQVAAAVPEPPRYKPCDEVAKHGPAVGYQSMYAQAIVEIVITDEALPPDDANYIVCKMIVLPNTAKGDGFRTGPDVRYHFDSKTKKGWTAHAYASIFQNDPNGRSVGATVKEAFISYWDPARGMVVQDPDKIGKGAK